VFEILFPPRARLVRRDRRVKFKTGLPGNQFRTNVASMSTMSVSELKKKPTKQWLKSASKDDLVITSKGQPIAVLLRIASASVESTRALVRSVRALQAQNALQQAAVVNGTSGFSMSDIDAEIAARRRARRRK
jgi:hypothetical protein